MIRSAVISNCGLYRYQLDRKWSDAPLLPFIMLNPSTADAYLDDATIRRCIGFARREGAGGIRVMNLYALRSTDPRAIKNSDNPIGPENDAHLVGMATLAKRDGMNIVCAWGANAAENRVSNVIHRLQWASLVCLGKTKDGHPRHPLYVKADHPLVSLNGP